jgi:putative transposase
MVANHKRVYRLYRQEGLAMRRRRRKKWVRMGTTVTAAPTHPNARWSMDFVSDCLANGQTFRTLVVVDDYTRENLAVEVDTSLSGLRVQRVLEAVVVERGRPGGIVVDNGPEFRSRVMQAWSEQRHVSLQFIEPGRPMQNAFVESFNGRLRDECLNSNWFLNLRDARRKIRAWVRDYNEQRPHSSLGYLTPSEFAASARAS